MFIMPIVAELFLVHGRALGFNAIYIVPTRLYGRIPVLLARKMRKMKAQACVSVCLSVCEWFGMGGGNSLHASIFFFVNGGVRFVGAVKATSKHHITAALKCR